MSVALAQYFDLAPAVARYEIERFSVELLEGQPFEWGSAILNEWHPMTVKRYSVRVFLLG
jgi:hypothetical protein